MSVDEKRSPRKARMSWVALAAAKIAVVILALFVVSSSSAAIGTAQKVDGRMQPLGELLGWFGETEMEVENGS